MFIASGPRAAGRRSVHRNLEFSREKHYLKAMARPRFQVIRVTDRAAERVREIVENAEGAEGIRIGIKKGGCAGMEYTVDLVTEPNPKDDHIERDGAHVYVAPEAALFLFGTVMDFEATTLRTGFTFTNPNQSSACGCGESVELKPADLKQLAEARAQSAA